MKVIISTAVGWTLDLIFPIKCIFCRRISKKEDYVCKKCQKSIPIRKSFECIGCKKPANFGQTCCICKESYSVDRLFVASDFENIKIKKLLKHFKFQFIKDLERPIYQILAKYFIWLAKSGKFNIFGGNPLLVPVPLSQYRLNWRGYNQSELLCRNISNYMQFESNSGLLCRVKSTPQADIKSKLERQNNIVGQFKFVGHHLTGQDVVLVDDICSSGSTLNECARVLKQNGAGKIYALVVARG